MTLDEFIENEWLDYSTNFNDQDYETWIDINQERLGEMYIDYCEELNNAK